MGVSCHCVSLSFVNRYKLAHDEQDLGGKGWGGGGFFFFFFFFFQLDKNLCCCELTNKCHRD